MNAWGGGNGEGQGMHARKNASHCPNHRRKYVGGGNVFQQSVPISNCRESQIIEGKKKQMER